jgi:hypothetical protein
LIAIYLFYDKATGKQSLYTTRGIKHCNVICFDGRDYILFETQPQGIGFRRILAKNTNSIIRNIKRIESIIEIICVHISEKKTIKWFPFWIRSCNEVCRFFSGIDTGLTLNPTHLIKKLLKYNNKRNYEILYQWSRSNEQQ